ncbi:hypothetical protein [Mammaliicoccus sciuri]|uniref:hypothetical protein n=1 Tax=Mammaliicoccus sciuri TaxID=1296 RepID=UPI001950CD5B|nr:hypothetical protein [Mammaliicoccus sciuri]
MEEINWLYQSLNWGVSIIATPFITYIFTRRSMNKQHKNEIEKLNQTYFNNRKSIINDKQIEKLIELHDMFSKEATSVNYIVNSNISYFTKVLNGVIIADISTWEDKNKSILENETTKINYIPQIRNRLLLLTTDAKSKIKEASIKMAKVDYNFVKMDSNIKYHMPNIMFDKAKDNNLKKEDIDKYRAFSLNYYYLIERINDLIEAEIEGIIKKDTSKN